MPLEKQKTNIIDTLYKMHDNMREYTLDIEDNLQKAYSNLSGGYQKKFGFTDNLAATVDDADRDY